MVNLLIKLSDIKTFCFLHESKTSKILNKYSKNLEIIREIKQLKN
jgi:hypothetical protein